ncbi:MAG: SMI1/KNR4 family protein [Planctomycetales bacterium]|nr:SMI1/KNR4 family protein [Planctomycetales bacterium]
MDKQIRLLLQHCERHDGVSGEQLSVLQRIAGDRLPEWYLDLMRWSNGLEGFIGSDNYLMLYSADEIPDANSGYVAENIPHLFIIGSNGGDAGYAIDLNTDNRPVVEVTFVDLELVRVVGRSLLEFLENLHRE